MHLHVTLRDGFNDDTVSIKVNERTVFDKSGVTSDLTISRADAFEVLVGDPIVWLEVTVAGGPRCRQKIRVPETPSIDIWIISGEIEVRKSVPMM